MSELSQLWWTQVHGPNAFLEEFCQELSKGGCFFLHHSRTLPWPEQFLNEVHRRVQLLQGHFGVGDPVDIPEDIPKNGLGQWFVERFLPQQADNFLSTTPLSDFLTGIGGLNHRMIWLRARSEDQLKQWLTLLSQFAARPESRESIVILEGGGRPQSRRKVVLFDLDGRFTSFDVVQLCTIAANGTQCKGSYKPYLTHLLDQLSAQDPCLVERLAEYGGELVEDPAAKALGIGVAPAEAARRVRRAQLLLLLPIIEDIRIHSLGQLYQQCLSLLPVCDDYGNELTDVYELELRHIVHYYHCGQLSMSPERWDEVKTAYDIRNSLMHNMTSMPFHEVERLLLVVSKLEDC